jgi:hypothetical protein
MPLLRLVYFSTNKIVSGPAVAADLKHILNSSIRRNAHAGITGGLLFNRKYFVQVLEGEPSDLLKTFTRITVDQRHEDVVLVEQKPVSRRLFGAWSMGFAGKTELFDSLVGRFCPSREFDPRMMAADQLATFVFEMVSRENGFISGSEPEVVEV